MQRTSVPTRSFWWVVLALGTSLAMVSDARGATTAGLDFVLLRFLNRL